jgi:hypothetical protein
LDSRSAAGRTVIVVKKAIDPHVLMAAVQAGSMSKAAALLNTG